MTCGAATLLVGVTAVHAAGGAMPPAGSGEWSFEVTLDGKPIGTHRFMVTGAPTQDGTGFEGRVVGNADFTVRLLGIPVYRYHHESKASWRGGCLQALQADTDDNGKIHKVTAKRQGDELQVDPSGEANPQAAQAAAGYPGCVMDYAYWSPSLRQQGRLLNPQTGRLDEVRITSLGNKDISVRGDSVKAEGWRVEGPEQPIDVWYAVSDGRWIGLDARLDGGRMLGYRLP